MRQILVVVATCFHLISEPSPPASTPKAARISSWRITGLKTELKTRIWRLLDPEHTGTRGSLLTNQIILGLILVSTGGLILETMPSSESYSQVFKVVDIAMVVAFTIEYLLRAWSCTSAPAYTQPVRGRLRYLLSPMLLIDLAAILPFFLPFIGVDLRFIRLFRFLRSMRVIKASRYSRATQLMFRVVKKKGDELIAATVLMFFLLIIASCFMYYCERNAQPGVFGSIPQAMWWAIVTLTTVGYGDVVPITAGGKIIAACFAVIGIGFIALPTGILSSGYMEEIRLAKGMPCPACNGTGSITHPPRDTRAPDEALH